MPKISTHDFKAGDLAVYPAHGVGVIKGIENREVSGDDLSFYILKVFDSDATIMVPIQNATTVGLRKVMKKSMATKVYDVLKTHDDSSIDNQTWNRRYREYTEKIKTGCVMEVAKVLRDLHLLKNDKELSFGERRMLDTAKNLLIKELSIAKKIKEETVEKELNTIMKKRKKKKG
jgi:CarD family transcriptional regulator